MAKSTASKVASLVLRILTIVLLLISLIVLTTTSKTVETDSGDLRLRFNNIIAYRYVLFTMVIGVAYSLLQLAFTIFSVISGSEGNLIFDFYGDKIISYFLATGTAAGLAVTKDLNAFFNQQLEDYEIDEFCSKGYASASLVLIAFLCTAILSVMSSYAIAANAKPSL
uniref:CASP-like protein n=1 Tax=Cannabis sativa TaxID=3483 RepID=A0A803P1U4_CANSA